MTLPVHPSGFAALILTAFLAGFVDAVVGGGGLIQLPGLFVVLPAVTPVATVLGTNKLVAFAGTAVAACRYGQHLRIDPNVVVPAGLAAFAFSGIGAALVRFVDPSRFKPVVLLLLVVIAAYTYLQKGFGVPRSSVGAGLSRRQRIVRSAAFSAAVGFYDGLVGPGTGSLLIFGFTAFLGYEFLAASALAKVVNVLTNIGALLTFVTSGHVLWPLALPMAVANIAGAEAGVRLAILKGSRFIRVFFLVVVGFMILRFSYELYLKG
ncbi:MAG TPA: TSUP family transporter [Chthoniobacterales bacterium]